MANFGKVTRQKVAGVKKVKAPLPPPVANPPHYKPPKSKLPPPTYGWNNKLPGEPGAVPPPGVEDHPVVHRTAAENSPYPV